MKAEKMTAEEIRLALEIMDMEDEKIGVLLDELADTCGCCGRRTKEGRTPAASRASPGT